MEISNREIAVLCWGGALLFFGLFHNEIRGSLKGILRAMLPPKVMLPLICYAGYVSVVVWILGKIGIWTPEFFKDVIVWFLFAGIGLLFVMATAKDQFAAYTEVVDKSIKVVILVEFLVSEYVFALWIEVLLIPVLVLIVGVNAVSKIKEEHAAVEKLSGNLLTVIGLAILGYALFQAWLDFENLGSLNTFRTLVLPPILSISVLPFLIVCLVFFNFETLFLKLRFARSLSSEDRCYAQRKLLVGLRLNPFDAKRYSEQNGLRLMQLESRQDIERLLDETL